MMYLNVLGVPCFQTGIEYLLFFGAVGDGDYFRPILHFLRTGRIDIPPNLCRAGVLTEAEFYCIEPFVDALKKEDCLREEEKAESLKNRGHFDCFCSLHTLQLA